MTESWYKMYYKKDKSYGEIVVAQYISTAIHFGLMCILFLVGRNNAVYWNGARIFFAVSVLIAILTQIGCTKREKNKAIKRGDYGSLSLVINTTISTILVYGLLFMILFIGKNNCTSLSLDFFSSWRLVCIFTFLNHYLA